LSGFTKATTRKSNEIYGRSASLTPLQELIRKCSSLLALRSCELLSNIGRTLVTSNGEIAFVDIK
jgi:hypothetical protein